jgi:hypothetical protein
MAWFSLRRSRRGESSRRVRSFRPEHQAGPERLEDRLVPTVLPAGFTQSIVASGLNGPSCMATAPDGRILSERNVRKRQRALDCRARAGRHGG